jgi:arginase
LSLREGRYICEELALTGRLRSMDLVEVNPRLRPEHAHLTIEAAGCLIRAALGKTLL